MPRQPAFAIGVATALAAVTALSGCGADHDTALAIQHARRLSPTTVELRTECADHLRVELTPQARAKPEVTIRGRPRFGRCQPALRLRLRTDQLIDATTSMAVQVQPRR